MLGIAVAVSFTVGVGLQEFAAGGAAKRIVLPLLYAGAGLLFVARGLRIPAPLPLWAWLPLPALAISFLGSAWLPMERTGLDPLAQGVLLFGGFTLLALLGRRSQAGWDQAQLNRLAWTLVLAGLAAGLLGRQGFAPFAALTVPAFFAAAVLWRSRPAGRPARLAMAAALGFLMVGAVSVEVGRSVSAAVLAQIATCAVLVLASWLPRAGRFLLLVAVATIALVWAAEANVMSLLAGNMISSDPTIAQRAYEAGAVMDQLSLSTWAQVFGFGPGGTVNLMTSPDAVTLAASGRDLGAVDDVHLLTAYVLLKFGALGLAWLALVAFALVRVAVAVLDGDPRRLALFMFAAAGFVNGVPAATNFLANPLVPLILGVLWVGRPARRADAPADHMAL